MVIAHLDEVTQCINQAAINLDLPVTISRTKPEIDKTFWVLLIGEGYPSPNMTMRWCTDRLKIQPTSTYIKKYISKYGAAIVVLGVRRDESQHRQRSIDCNSTSTTRAGKTIMKSSKFEEWLRQRGISEKTIAQQEYRTRRVEEEENNHIDLDESYEKDRLESLIEILTYYYSGFFCRQIKCHHVSWALIRRVKER